MIPALHVLGAPGLRTFFRISACWALDEEQERLLLGNPAHSTFAGWKRGDATEVSPDVLLRISSVLGIYEDLQLIFGRILQADGWIHRPNAAPLFGGKTTLELMTGHHMSGLYADSGFIGHIYRFALIKALADRARVPRPLPARSRLWPHSKAMRGDLGST